MELLTNESIFKDISEYEKKIQQAEIKLSELPDQTYDWATERQVQKKRQALLNDIDHYERLIEIARSALSR